MIYNLLIIEDSIPINEGLKILNEEIIDFVLFDFNTPDIDVFRFLDVMKKDESYKFIPIVIIITERSNPEAEDLLEKHSIDYIKLPINPTEMKQKLNRIMKKEDEVEENQISKNRRLK
jgi:DNA-binding NtrC family response regulator